MVNPQPNAETWEPRSADLVDQVHVSGALSGDCTGKGPRMANPRPTPKPGPGSEVFGSIRMKILPV